MAGSQFKSSIDGDRTLKIVEILQPLLTDLSDLALQLKHAHWNVRGALFLPLHEQLDTIHETVGNAVDEVAERIVTLGHPADGLVQSVASHTRLNPLRVQFLATQEVIEGISTRIHSVTDFLRQAIEETGDVDSVTQDMLIGITSQLEKHLWMLQSQQL